MPLWLHKDKSMWTIKIREAEKPREAFLGMKYLKTYIY